MRIDLQQQFTRMVGRRRLKSSREDAASQLVTVREMLEKVDVRDVAGMGIVALAMESCAETVKRHLAFCRECA